MLDNFPRDEGNISNDRDVFMNVDNRRSMCEMRKFYEK